MIVNDNTIQAEGLGSFFRNSARISEAVKKLELQKILQTLLPQRQLKAQKELHHHYLK